MDATVEGVSSGNGHEGRGVPVLLNGIAVLNSFTADEPELGVTDIAARVGLHKSTVSRILGTLEQAELVERDAATRRFRLGLGVIALAGPLLANLDVRPVAYPVLNELSERTGETAALMVWDGSESICVEQVPSSHQVKHSTPLGTRYRTALSSSVQIFCARFPAERVRTLLGSGSLLYHDRDDRGLEEYLARLAQVREQGYAVNYGETSVEEVGLSAPVRDHRSEQVAAVLLSAPRFRVSDEQVPILGETVRDAADRITSHLGGTQRRP